MENQLMGGPMVARGEKAFHVETHDREAMKAFFGNETHVRRSQEAPWKPIGQLRREYLHQMLDEWLDKGST